MPPNELGLLLLENGPEHTSDEEVGSVRGTQQVLLRWLPHDCPALWRLLLDGRAHHRHQCPLLRLRVSVAMWLGNRPRQSPLIVSSIAFQLSLPGPQNIARHSDPGRPALRLHDELTVPHVVYRPWHHSPGQSR